MNTRELASLIIVLLFLSPSWVSAGDFCQADLNGDGEVGPADLAMLLASWGPCPFCGDGVVNPGEECDPPDGVICGDDCQISVPTNCCFPHDPMSGCEDPSCQSAVCTVDPFCCDTEWDEQCAIEAAELCPECFGMDCCFASHPPGCTDPHCESLVCDSDTFCCETFWDHDCSHAAETFCPQCFP